MTRMLLALVMVVGMAVPAFATTLDNNVEMHDDVDAVAEIDIADDNHVASNEANNIQPLNELPYKESFWVGDSAEKAQMVRIFSYPSGYRGPITVNIMDFNPKKYKAYVMIYGTAGLLLRDDDWMGGVNFRVLNEAGEQAIQEVYIGITPRPVPLFQSPLEAI